MRSYRIVVSTKRCGRLDPGSIPGSSILFTFFCDFCIVANLTDQK